MELGGTMVLHLLRSPEALPPRPSLLHGGLICARSLRWREGGGGEGGEGEGEGRGWEPPPAGWWEGPAGGLGEVPPCQGWEVGFPPFSSEETPPSEASPFCLWGRTRMSYAAVSQAFGFWNRCFCDHQVLACHVGLKGQGVWGCPASGWPNEVFLDYAGLIGRG